MKWYLRDPAMAERERHRIMQAFPELSLETDNARSAVVTGVLRIVGDLGYSTYLIVPNDYPKGVPVLWCDPKEIPWNVDRHVYADTGRACLCVTSESRVHWPPGSDLTDFLSRLVVPYLLGQLYYDVHGHWPPTGQRSHGREGILEAYREFLEPLGSVSENVIHDTMRLMARITDPKGHDICPCGSGRKLRKCHRLLFSQLRRSIDRQHAQIDYGLAFDGRRPPYRDSLSASHHLPRRSSHPIANPREVL